MNMVDSSARLNCFADGPNAAHFAPAIESLETLLVPSIIVLEVFTRLAEQRHQFITLQCSAVMQQSTLVDMDAALALRAAALGIRYQLALADSIVHAMEQSADAIVWNQDVGFEGFSGVKCFGKAVA